MRGGEQRVDCREVVYQNVLLRVLSGFSALQFLDVVVGEGGEEGEVRGVAPERDLKHLHEDEEVLLSVARREFDIADEVFVVCGKLDDGRERGAEGERFLCREGVVVLPVGGFGEEAGEAAVQVAFGVEPGDGVPFWVAIGDGGELGVVGCDIAAAVVLERAVMVSRGICNEGRWG